VSRRREPKTVSDVAVDGPQSHVIVAPAVQATRQTAVQKQTDRVFSRVNRDATSDQQGNLAKAVAETAPTKKSDE